MDFLRNVTGFTVVFKQQALEGCLGGFLFLFLNEGDEDAQGRKQIHNGGLRHSEAFGSSVFSTWTKATMLCATLHNAPLFLCARLRSGVQF